MFRNIFILIFILAPFSKASAQYTDKFDMNSLVIQFEDASDEIVAKYIPLLYRLADTLNRNESIEVLVRGHVCCVKNNRLAKRRAKAVCYYLELFGVNAERLKIKGMRNSIPIVFPEKSKDDELANMRVDFVYSKK